MPKEIVVPNIGEVGIEIKFLGWLKSSGDFVKEGEPLFEVDAIKSVIEIPAYTSGILTDLRVFTGDIVEPQQVVAILLDPGELYSRDVGSKVLGEENHNNKKSKSIVIIPPSPQKGGEKVNTTPRAKKLASEMQINLSTVKGTGLNGLIMANDVLESVKKEGKSIIEKKKIRKVISEITTRSWQTIPHFYLNLNADITKSIIKAKPMAIVSQAIARALHEIPDLNIAWRENELVQLTSVNLGILVMTPKGLLLPTINDADQLSLKDLHQAIEDVAERARGDSLLQKDFGNRSITISNLGMHSVDQFNGIISTPDILLLSIGRVKVLPSWDGNQWIPRNVISLTLAVDHRALDGVDAAKLFDRLESIFNE